MTAKLLTSDTDPKGSRRSTRHHSKHSSAIDIPASARYVKITKPISDASIDVELFREVMKKERRSDRESSLDNVSRLRSRCYDTDLSDDERSLWKKCTKHWEEENGSPIPDQLLAIAIRLIMKPNVTKADNPGIVFAEMLKRYITWRTTPDLFPISDSDKSIKTLLDRGCMYIFGRDRHQNPTLVYSIARIIEMNVQEDDLILLLTFCMDYAHRFLLVPGHSERLNFMIDVQDVSTTSIPMKLLKSILQDSEWKWPLMGAKTFILNHSRTLRAAWSGVSSVFPEEILGNIHFVKCEKNRRSSSFDDGTLSSFYDREIVPVELGGKRKVNKYYPFPMYSANGTAAGIPALFDESIMSEVPHVVDPPREGQETVGKRILLKYPEAAKLYRDVK